MDRKKNIKKVAGFTLVELVAVMVIIGLLVGMVSVGILRRVEKARIQATQAQISNFGTAITTFQLECGFYPASLNDLINPSASGKTCKGAPPEGFLSRRESPDDPWGDAYNYQQPGTHNPESYDLWSSGPDKEEGTTDDITNWTAEK